MGVLIGSHHDGGGEGDKGREGFVGVLIGSYIMTGRGGQGGGLGGQRGLRRLVDRLTARSWLSGAP